MLSQDIGNLIISNPATLGMKIVGPMIWKDMKAYE